MVEVLWRGQGMDMVMGGEKCIFNISQNLSEMLILANDHEILVVYVKGHGK